MNLLPRLRLQLLSTNTPPGGGDDVPSHWPVGYDRIVLEQTDNTMAEARRRLGEISCPTWILALSQSSARGRRGRAWAHPPGNFAATLVMRPRADPMLAALRSFVASLALYDTLRGYAPDASIALKWPNDVLLKGGKVAGILLESAGQGGDVDWLSIGIGVNLLVAPAPETVEHDALRPVCLLSQGGARVSPEVFLTSLARAFAIYETQFQTFGFDPIRRAWLSHAARLGDVITARTGQDAFTGTFETLDGQGNLVLRTPEGVRAIAAAEIYF
ncbi:MAG: BirA family biotin operon repressor/biotin-[acetyl-CoA-carboxylase] ligase [Paracoccaceae bacterium]